mmetsp:Transcript_26610/g.67658  ORF Transcript_26610/g.67658 Transcript_26610/m.67658 type:complete len:217 (-) Transcript_26610:588-1238(-)
MLSRTVWFWIQGSCVHIAIDPRKTTRPESSGTSPTSAERRLDLPLPTGPPTPTSDPCGKASETLTSVGGNTGFGVSSSATGAVDETVPAGMRPWRSWRPWLPPAPPRTLPPAFFFSFSSSFGSGHLKVHARIEMASTPCGAVAGSWKMPSSSVSGFIGAGGRPGEKSSYEVGAGRTRRCTGRSGARRNLVRRPSTTSRSISLVIIIGTTSSGKRST